MRTNEEIQKQINWLQRVKPFIRPSGFGDDNQEAIDVQIKVLEEKPESFDALDDLKDEEVWEGMHLTDAADSVFEWLTENSDESPFDEWQHLAPQQFKTLD